MTEKKNGRARKMPLARYLGSAYWASALQLRRSWTWFGVETSRRAQLRLRPTARPMKSLSVTPPPPLLAPPTCHGALRR